MQRLITDQLERAEQARVHEELARRPINDVESVTWRSLNGYSSYFMLSVPRRPGEAMSNAHYAVGCEMYFGQPCAMAAPLEALGAKIAGKVVDRYGNVAVSHAGKAAAQWRHDAMKLTLSACFRRHPGMMFVLEALNVFAHCVHHMPMDDDEDSDADDADDVADVADRQRAAAKKREKTKKRLRRRQGLIPDFLAQLEGNGPRQLLDVKCTSMCVSNHGPRNAWMKRGQPRCAALQHYEDGVDLHYHSKARRFDQHVNRTPAGEVGPLEAELKRYPPVQGLVFGPCGAASRNVDRILKLCARGAAGNEWREDGARSPTEAYGHIITAFRRDVGIMAVRSHAEVKVHGLRMALSHTNPADVRQAMARRAATAARHRAHNRAYFMRHGWERGSLAVAVAALSERQQRGPPGAAASTPPAPLSSSASSSASASSASASPPLPAAAPLSAADTVSYAPAGGTELFGSAGMSWTVHGSESSWGSVGAGAGTAVPGRSGPSPTPRGASSARPEPRSGSTGAGAGEGGAGHGGSSSSPLSRTGSSGRPPPSSGSPAVSTVVLKDGTRWYVSYGDGDRDTEGDNSEGAGEGGAGVPHHHK